MAGVAVSFVIALHVLLLLLLIVSLVVLNRGVAFDERNFVSLMSIGIENTFDGGDGVCGVCFCSGSMIFAFQ